MKELAELADGPSWCTCDGKGTAREEDEEILHCCTSDLPLAFRLTFNRHKSSMTIVAWLLGDHFLKRILGLMGKHL